MKLQTLIRNFSILFLALLIISGLRPPTSAAKYETAAERWRQNGPTGGTVNVVHRVGGMYLAGTHGGGIYRASALDSPWTHVEDYAPTSTLSESLVVYSFASNASAIFAATNQGVFRSTDNGVSWELLENLSNIAFAFELACNDSVVVAALGGAGVFRSLNGGLDWVAANNGLTVSTFTSVGNTGSTFFAAGNGGRIYRSTDNAQNWVLVGAGLPVGLQIKDIEIVTSPEPYVFIATSNGIYRSSDNGATFNDFSHGLRTRFVNEISYTGTDLYAATGEGVFYSTDRGLSWLERTSGIGNRVVESVTVAPSGKYMAGTLSSGVFISDSAGASWRAHNANLFGFIVEQLYSLSDSTILAGMNFGGGIWRSNDSGGTWEKPVGAPRDPNCFLQIGAKVLAGTTSNGLYISSDSGANWAVRNRTLPFTRMLVASGANLFAATTEGVFRSADEGGLWTRTSVGLPASGVNTIYAMLDGRLYVGTFNGVFVSNNQGDSWTPLNNGLTEPNVLSLLSLGGALYAGTADGIFKFNGVSQWTPVNNGLPATPNRRVRAMRGLGATVLFAGLQNGVYYSLDEAQTWTPYSDGLTHGDVLTFMNGSALRVGTNGNGVFTVNLRDFECRFTITPASRTHTAAPSSDNVSVADPLACSWRATSNASWLTITAGATGLRNGTVTYSVAANTTGANRTGTLTIAGQTFTVTQTTQVPNPVPVVSTVAPNLIYEGAEFPRLITINGSNFVNGAEVRWNGTPLVTNYISATQLTATPPVAIDFVPLAASVSVFNPTPGGGGSRETAPIILERKTVSVSAASYADNLTVAPNSIAAMFGVGMGTTTQVARTSPLPTTLGGATVRVKDSRGDERLAPLFFVAPLQINYLVPPETALGNAEVRITRTDGKRFLGYVTVAKIAPGLFTANANGSGVPAAQVLRITASGALSYENVARFDTVLSKFLVEPINFGPATDQLFLVLYGTGLRGFGNPHSTQVVNLGGTNLTPLFVGTAPGFFGLDQVNVALPRPFAGRGTINLRLTLDGLNSNTLDLAFR